MLYAKRICRFAVLVLMTNLLFLNCVETQAEPVQWYRLLVYPIYHRYTTDCNELISLQKSVHHPPESAPDCIFWKCPGAFPDKCPTCQISPLMATIEPTNVFLETNNVEDSTQLFHLFWGIDDFYTQKADERQWAKAKGYADRNDVLYISTKPGNGKTALYRAFNGKAGHFYTTSLNEYNDVRDTKGFTQEGIVGYVWTNGKSQCTNLGPPRPGRCTCRQSLGPVHDPYGAPFIAWVFYQDCCRKYCESNAGVCFDNATPFFEPDVHR